VAEVNVHQSVDIWMTCEHLEDDFLCWKCDYDKNITKKATKAEAAMVSSFLISVHSNDSNVAQVRRSYLENGADFSGSQLTHLTCRTFTHQGIGGNTSFLLERPASPMLDVVRFSVQDNIVVHENVVVEVVHDAQHFIAGHENVGTTFVLQLASHFVCLPDGFDGVDTGGTTKLSDEPVDLLIADEERELANEDVLCRTIDGVDRGAFLCWHRWQLGHRLLALHLRVRVDGLVGLFVVASGGVEACFTLARKGLDVHGRVIEDVAVRVVSVARGHELVVCGVKCGVEVRSHC